MSTEIQPCPRCGGEIEVVQFSGWDLWQWKCSGCPARTLFTFDTEAEAIEDANRRVPSRTEAGEEPDDES